MQEKNRAKHKYQKTKAKPKGLYSSNDKEYVFGDNTVRKKGTLVKVLFIILPILMIVILLTGAYFGYLNYEHNVSGEGNPVQENKAYVSVEQQKTLIRIVGISNPIERNYVPDTTTVQSTEVSTIMSDSLKDMLDSAGREGINLQIKRGYVSFDEQHVLYENYVNSLMSTGKYTQVKAESIGNRKIADSGYSERQLGLSVEFDCDNKNDFNTTEEYKWLIKNGADFGFMQRYTDTSEQLSTMDKDYTLWRYIGRDNALLARKLGLNFDEIAQYLQN